MERKSRNAFHPFWKMWEALTKATNIGALIFMLILHTYAAILLYQSGIILEIILPTLIFDYLIIGGSILFWLLAGRGQRGGFFTWLSYLGPMVVNAFVIIWQIEEFDTFTPPFNLSFPLNHGLILVWMGLLILSLTVS